MAAGRSPTPRPTVRSASPATTRWRRITSRVFHCRRSWVLSRAATFPKASPRTRDAMTDIPNTQPDSRETTILEAPDKMVKVRDLFGIDSDMEVPAFSEADERVPDLDPAYVFDGDTTLAICAGFAHIRRVMVQGYHGTGKSTHIAQVAARLNWPCIRINLDSHISRLALLGKEAIVLRDERAWI